MKYYETIRSLEPCEAGCEDDGELCEMKKALLYLEGKATEYGETTHALAPLLKPEKPKRYIALHMRMGRRKRNQAGARITRMDIVGESSESTTGVMDTSGLHTFLKENLLTRKTSGSLIVTSGQERRVLDFFLEQFGELLCQDGYILKPRLSGSSVSYIQVSKRGGRESWAIVYAETMSGVDLSTLLGYAEDAKRYAGIGPESIRNTVASQDCHALYDAVGAYQDLLLDRFGVAINPTAGMTAIKCARRCLPEDFRKWRPDPLLVAMERWGKGYRGGMTHAIRYKGPSTRIDVTRQYTQALAADLPYKVAFGRWRGEDDNGIFLCQVRFHHPIAYPIGVWDGDGFVTRTVPSGTIVCVLHTTEFPGLRAMGATIVPYYGYAYTRVFTFGRYVECLQSILDYYGYDSFASKIVKPLGNYLYGKFGQHPVRKELAYSKERPGPQWASYVDDQLKEWPLMWERTVTRHTSSQHVDIAGTITGAARSQVLLMWRRCVTYGLTVVRCHTDSLTVNTASLPPGLGVSTEAQKIGEWRVECSTDNSVYVGANAYLDSKGAHISGVSKPTAEMIERIHDGHIVHVIQEERNPLRGFSQRVRKVRKRYGS